MKCSHFFFIFKAKLLIFWVIGHDNDLVTWLVAPLNWSTFVKVVFKGALDLSPSRGLFPNQSLNPPQSLNVFMWSTSFGPFSCHFYCFYQAVINTFANLKISHGWSCLDLFLCISYSWTLSHLGNNVIIFMPFLTFLLFKPFKYDSKSHQMLLQATSLTLSTVLTIFSSLQMHIPIRYFWTLTLLTSKTLHPHP